MKEFVLCILLCYAVSLYGAAEAAFKYEGVRLRGGPTPGQGKVEVFRKAEDGSGQWGAVCDNHWSLTEADVVCKQLGFEDAEKALTKSPYGEARGGIWLKNVRCRGSESSIADCHFEEISRDISYYEQVDEINDCSYGHQAAVVCKEPENPDAKMVELTPIPDKTTSLVTMELDGEFYPICWNTWTNKNAIVACRQAKNNFAKITEPINSTQIPTPYHSAIQAIKCTSDESSLQNCETTVGEICTKYVTVECSDSAPDISVNITALQKSIWVKKKKESKMICAKEEGCMASNKTIQELKNSQDERKLLVFTSNVQNFGNADFRPPHTQKWHYHKCHNHIHSIVDFATYELRSNDGTVVEVGHKVSFCLRDNACVDNSKRFYNCRDVPGGDQGISVGCADHYTNKLDCQWIDVTNVKPGKYTLEIRSNPYMVVSEQDYTNNFVICEVTLGKRRARGSNCRWPGDFEA